MPDPHSANRMKINKAVYQLLETYHRTFGLSVVCWSKPPGNHYFSFYCLGARDDLGRPLHLPDISGRFSLTIYQDHIGLPAWGAGQQWSHPEAHKRELRTAELIAWYEERLDFEKLFEDYALQIRGWRDAYHVSQSEPFLLSWNVVGLVASRQQALISTFGRSEYYSGIPDSEKAVVADLECVVPSESAHFVGDVVFSTMGRVRLPDGQHLDMWGKRLCGERPETIADDIVNLAGLATGSEGSPV